MNPGADTPVFRAEALTFSYPGAPEPAIRELTIDVRPGELFAFLGPNGSGKSTLFRLLLGARRPGLGSVHYQGIRLSDWNRRDLARVIGVVPQIEEIAFPVSVREMVSMGRYPHLGPWRAEGPADRQAVAEAMELADVAHLADRPFDTLSGGERQRARIGRALAQSPETLVLDEPSAALDIRHEMGIFELLGRLSASGVTVLLVTHNLNLAARFATRVLLLDAGSAVGAGVPDEVLTGDAVQRVYRWPVALTRHPGPGPDAGAPQVVPLSQRPVR